MFVINSIGVYSHFTNTFCSNRADRKKGGKRVFSRFFFGACKLIADCDSLDGLKLYSARFAMANRTTHSRPVPLLSKKPSALHVGPNSPSDSGPELSISGPTGVVTPNLPALRPIVPVSETKNEFGEKERLMLKQQEREEKERLGLLRLQELQQQDLAKQQERDEKERVALARLKELQEKDEQQKQEQAKFGTLGRRPMDLFRQNTETGTSSTNKRDEQQKQEQSKFGSLGGKKPVELSRQNTVDSSTKESEKPVSSVSQLAAHFLTLPNRSTAKKPEV